MEIISPGSALDALAFSASKGIAQHITDMLAVRGINNEATKGKQTNFNACIPEPDVIRDKQIKANTRHKQDYY